MEELEVLKARRAKDAERKRAARAKEQQQRKASTKFAARAADPDRELKDAAAREARERRRKKPIELQPKKLETPAGLSHTGRWLPLTPITYISTETNERVVEPPTIKTDEFGEVENYLDDIEEGVALDFHRRGAVEPELVPAHS